MDNLNPIQHQILTFFSERQQQGLPPPTYREIVAATGLSSTSVAHSHLERLVELGRLESMPGVARGYWLKPAPARSLDPPVAQLRQDQQLLRERLDELQQKLSQVRLELVQTRQEADGLRLALQTAQERIRRLKEQLTIDN